MPYQFLANTVLATHVAIVAFVVLGLLLIIAGNWLHWRPINRLWFRALHLGAIAFVVAESWLDITCPLTTLEMWLRSKANQTTYGEGFIEHWLQTVLYYDAPPWVFVLAYTVFGLLVVLTWWLYPPTFKRQAHIAQP